jgi:hypothetical protein
MFTTRIQHKRYRLDDLTRWSVVKSCSSCKIFSSFIRFLWMRVGETYLQYREGRHSHWILTFCVTVMVRSIGNGSPSADVRHEVWLFVMFFCTVRINVPLKWKARGIRFRNCSLRILLRNWRETNIKYCIGY